MYEHMDHFSLFSDACEDIGLDPKTERARLCLLCRVNNFEAVPVAYLDAWAAALGVPCETEDHYGPGHDHISAAHTARATYAAALGALAAFTLTHGTQSTRLHLQNELRLLDEMAGTFTRPAPSPLPGAAHNPFV